MNRDVLGYLLGLVIFIIGIPYLMFLVSGSPELAETGLMRLLMLVLLSLIGIALSVWSIVYMKNVGRGNPFDAFNHEIGLRTDSLMTDGPYGICRNPMLLGVFIYHFGVFTALLTPGALIVFIVEIAIMSFQVKKEEQRLRRDFGKDYEEYVENSNRFLPRLR